MFAWMPLLRGPARVCGRGRGRTRTHAAARPCLIAVTIAAAITPAVPAVAGAAAGEYHVYSCRTPLGAVAPVDGWSGTTSGSGVVAENECANHGALVAALGDGIAHARTDISTWTFALPAGDAMAKATIWRAGDADGGSSAGGSYEFWLAAPTEQQSFDECLYSSCATGKGEPKEPLSPANRLELEPSHLGANIYVNAACFAPAGSCKVGERDPNGYAAVVYLYAADITLKQTSQPTVPKGEVGGELATAATVKGVEDVTFYAEDSGSGVYEAIFTVDGAEVGRTVLDENEGRCKQVGEATDGLPDFLYAQPCKASLSADVRLDTTRLSDGTHHLVVSVSDAAGNEAVALDRTIDVANALPSSQLPSSSSGTPTGSSGSGSTGGSISPTGAPNGRGASASAALSAHWSADKRSSVTGRYGRAETIVGRLTGPGGAPIAGATIEAVARSTTEGATAATVGHPRTDAHGRFRLRLARRLTSQQVVLAYRAHLGDPAPAVQATLTLTVPASLTLKVAPRVAHLGATIALKGILRGGPIPPGGKQLVLEARTTGSGWLQFQALSTSPHGRYRATYRFRLPGPIVYELRAVCPHEADYPFAAGVSNVVRVRER